MGQGSRRSNNSVLKRGDGLGSGPEEVVLDCQIRVTVDAEIVGQAQTPAGVISVMDQAMVLLDGDTVVARIAESSTTRRLANCIAQGFEYCGQLRVDGGRAFVDVEPSR